MHTLNVICKVIKPNKNVFFFLVKTTGTDLKLGITPMILLLKL